MPETTPKEMRFDYYDIARIGRLIISFVLIKNNLYFYEPLEKVFFPLFLVFILFFVISRCERIIRQGITVDNVAMLYATAIKYQVTIHLMF